MNSDRSSDQLEPENSKNKRPGAFNNNSNNYLSDSSAKDGDGEYAAVIVNTAPQQKMESNESGPEILYTSFDHGPKSSVSNDSDEVDGGRVVYKPGRSETIYAPPSDDDTYANARE